MSGTISCKMKQLIFGSLLSISANSVFSTTAHAKMSRSSNHKYIFNDWIFFSYFRQGLPILLNDDGAFNNILMLGKENSDKFMLKK